MSEFYREEGAVSEIIGYISIFGIVIISMSIIYTSAFPILWDAQDSQYLQNVNAAFKVVKFNIDRIVSGHSPSQTTEVKLKDSSLGIFGESRMNVSWKGYNETSGGWDSENSIVTLLTVEHGYKFRRIACEGGGVWVKYPEGSLEVVSEPSLVIGNVTVISVGAISGDNATIAKTEGVGRIKLKSIDYIGTRQPPSVSEETNARDITIEVQSEYCEGWKRYFNDTAQLELDDSNCSNGNVVANVSKSYGNADLYINTAYIQGEVY